MSTSKRIYSSDSQSMVYSDELSSNGFKFDLELYLKECEEEEKRLMNAKNLMMPGKKGNSKSQKKSQKVNQQGMETKKTSQVKKATEKPKGLSLVILEKPKSEFKSEVEPESFAKGQKVDKSISVDDRNWSTFKDQLPKVNSNKPKLPKKTTNQRAPLLVKKKSERGLKKKKVNLIERCRLNSERRRNMEKRHNLRMLKLNQLNQNASKSTSQEKGFIKIPKVCQSATEPQERNDFNIVFLTPRVQVRSQSQTKDNISSDSSDSSSKSGKFIMSKSELDLRIQQAVDEQFRKLKQEQQALRELDRENEIKMNWTVSKANFLMSPSVESFKSLISIVPSVTQLVIKETKSFVPHFKLFAFIILAIICIFSWIYEFGEPVERLQNAFNDLFADNSKPKKMGFFY